MAENTEIDDLVVDLDNPAPEGITLDGQEEEEELVIQIGDEEAPPQEKEEAPQWVKDLRKSQRELLKENRELKAKQVQPKDEPVKLPNRPALADFEYDEDKHQAALDDWYAKKSEMDKLEAKKQEAIDQANRQVQAEQSDYKEKAKALKVKDYEAAEEVVIAALSETQQGLILKGAKHAPMLVYALAHNPKKLAELSAIKDLSQFAFAAGEIQGSLKVINRKSEKPAPEAVLKSSGPIVASIKTLEKLREEAQRTGDLSKVLAFKRAQRK